MADRSYTGGCLCGGVRYAIAGPLEAPVACHCSQCARTSGNYATMAAFEATALSLVKGETLALYRSSRHVRRGFCNRCGGNLFWRADHETKGYVATGTLDRPTGLRLGGHIFVGSQSDVYEIIDDLPKKLEW